MFSLCNIYNKFNCFKLIKNNNKIIKIYFSLKKNYSNIYDRIINIEDTNIAKKTANILIQDSNLNIPIIEIYPGNALITSYLLDKKVKKIITLVKRENEINILEELKKKYNNRLKIIQLNNLSQLFNFPSLYNEILKEISKKNWEDSIVCKLFVIVNSKKYFILRNLFKCITFQSGILSSGRIQIYAFLPKTEYIIIKGFSLFQSYSKYRPATVLYNSLFNVDLIETISSKNLNIKKKITEYYFVKIEPKKNLKDLINFDYLPLYAFFVTQSMLNKNKIILELAEKWSPGIGVKLINEGIPLFKKIGDVAPNEFINLFNLIIKHSKNEQGDVNLFTELYDNSVFQEIKFDI